LVHTSTFSTTCGVSDWVGISVSDVDQQPTKTKTVANTATKESFFMDTKDIK
jgi:hypothetical protein